MQYAFFCVYSPGGVDVVVVVVVVVGGADEDVNIDVDVDVSGTLVDISSEFELHVTKPGE